MQFLEGRLSIERQRLMRGYSVLGRMYRAIVYALASLRADLSRGSSVVGQCIRAGGYALTSFFAHLSGYLLQADRQRPTDFLLVLALWLTSLPFFLDYAITYHVEEPHDDWDERAAEWAKSNARPILLAFSISSTIIVLLSHRIQTGRIAHPLFYSMLFLFAVMFIAYGRYLVRLAKTNYPPVMRHHLVWPVILSIALPLYSGILFSGSGSNKLMFSPIAFLIISFLITRKLARWKFLVVNSVPVALVVVAVLSGLDGYIEYFVVMSFYLVIAAYLAVFEAWGITANLTLRDSVVGESLRSSQSYRHYLATFAALCVAALGMPVLYIFSNYGRFFFYGMVIHTIGAFFVWYWVGGNFERLRSNKWLWGKTIGGFLFLLILVGDGLFRSAPVKRFFPSYVDLDLVTWVGGLSLGAIAYVQRRDRISGFGDWFREIRGRRAGVLVLMIGLSIIMAIGVIGVEDQFPLGPEVLKGDRAFMFYLGAMILAVVTLLGGGGGKFFRNFWGALLLIRGFTSGVIGLSVLLPALRSGESLMEGSVHALPFFLASAAGFAFNDFFDYERDLISKPFRPLPRGLLSRSKALGIGLALIFASGVAVILNDGQSAGRAIQVIAILGVISYNIVVSKAGWAKGAFSAALCMLPLTYVIEEFGYPERYWWLVAGGYIFCIGREILMDILDLSGDLKTGLTTLPMLLGLSLSQGIALFSSALSLLALLVFRELSGAAGQKLIIDLSVIGIFVLGLLWRYLPSLPSRRRVIRMAWIPMLLILSTFLS